MNGKLTNELETVRETFVRLKRDVRGPDTKQSTKRTTTQKGNSSVSAGSPR